MGRKRRLCRNALFLYRPEYPFKERVKAENFNSKKLKADAGAEPATSRPARKSANHLATRTVIGPEKNCPIKSRDTKRQKYPKIPSSFVLFLTVS